MTDVWVTGLVLGFVTPMPLIITALIYRMARGSSDEIFKD